MEDNKKTILFTINGENFLMKTAILTRKERITIESLLASFRDDYPEETEGLDSLALCGWLQDKLKTDYDIVLENAGVDFEFKI